jgi:hypothetical protein
MSSDLKAMDAGPDILSFQPLPGDSGQRLLNLQPFYQKGGHGEHKSTVHEIMMRSGCSFTTRK